MSEQALHAEVQRLQCLQALGITVYHPRFRLPGAKPSAPGAWVEAAPRPDEERGVTGLPPDARPGPVEPRPAVVTPDKQAFPAGTPSATVAAQAQPARNPPSVAAPRAAAPATVPNFQLLFLQVDADLALVNQLPALARPQLQDKQLTLLANLLRWLGKPVPDQAPRMFRWPLPGLEHMAASMSAETSLLHFLEQACTERRFRYLLQLGPQAVAAPSQAWQSFATHSLDEMLALPALKREAWQTLLPLHGLLQAQA